MRHKVTIEIAPDLFDQITAILAAGKQVEHVGRDERLFEETVDLPNNRQMDIKVVNAETEGGGPWCEGVLYEGGQERGMTEVGEELGGEFIVPDGDDEYCVTVKRRDVVVVTPNPSLLAEAKEHMSGRSFRQMLDEFGAE